MTREKDINIIREACIKANPEIIASEIIEGSYAQLRLVLSVLPMIGRTETMVRLQGFGGEFNLDLCEPAPRPIRLADVLLAFRNQEVITGIRIDGLWLSVEIEDDLLWWMLVGF